MIKKILKIVLLLLLILFTLFLWKKRVYLQQVIPIVGQLIEQQYRWNQNNTGTYVYRYMSNINIFGGAERFNHCLLFIKDEKIQRVIQLGEYDLKYVANREVIESIYLNDLESHHDSYYLIDASFNDIWLALWEENFSLSIEYDEVYGYVKGVYWVFENPIEYNSKITLDGINELWRGATELKMLASNTQFTDEVLTEILEEYKKRDIQMMKCRRFNECLDVNTTEILIEKVGGDRVRGVVSKSSSL